MRIPRLPTMTLVAPAVLLALTIPTALLGPAGAATGAAPGTPTGAVSRHATHPLKVGAKELDHSDRFVLYGKVPSYPRGKVVLVRSVADGPYAKQGLVKTSRTGRFRVRISQVPGKLTCYKVVVPKTSEFRRTRSKGALCISDLS